jgi:hypothetical protein
MTEIKIIVITYLDIALTVNNVDKIGMCINDNQSLFFFQSQSFFSFTF